MAKAGVVSFNTTDTWLDVKICDGALETRRLLTNHGCEIVQDDSIRIYSQDDGGDVNTFIIAISNTHNQFVFNNNQMEYNDAFYQPTFLRSLCVLATAFHSKPINTYTGVLKGHRSSNKHGTNTNKWRSFLYSEAHTGAFYLAVKCRVMESSFNGSFKLIKHDDLKSFVDDECEGEVKGCRVEYEHGCWLLGFLNTTFANQYVRQASRVTISHNSTASIYELSNNLWPLLQVPDFDFYKQDRPEHFAAYMSWIEANMRDKDAFLAGIDEQFNQLIS
jgi:hypothetical protein